MHLRCDTSKPFIIIAHIMSLYWHWHSSAFGAITFSSKGRFINPSRVSPLDVYTVNTHPDGSRSVLYANDTMAVCVSCIYTTASYLYSTPERGIIQHYIAGIFHSQEWEHFCSFLTMVFNKAELHAQVSGDAVSFSTKSAPKCALSFSFMCSIIY